MLIVDKRRYKKLHIIGGAGIFDSVANFFKGLIPSGFASSSAGSKLLSVGKDAAKEIGKRALDVGKTTAIDVGKRLVDKAANKFLNPKNQEVISQLTNLRRDEPAAITQPTAITQKTKDILLSTFTRAIPVNLGEDAPLFDATLGDINNLLMGSAVRCNARKCTARRCNARRSGRSSARPVPIQDLVKRLNGAGMKVV